MPQFSSTQFDLNYTDSKEIQDFIETFIDKNDLHEFGIENQNHITVKYGIHTQLSNEISQVVKKVKPVTVMLGKTSIFEVEDDNGESYDVVKIDVISGDLRKLNKLLSKELEVTDTYSYKPHLTLAYVKQGLGSKYTGDKTFEDKVITFNKLTFSPIEGEDTFIYLNRENIDE